MIDYNYGTNSHHRSSPFEVLNLTFPGKANTNISFKDACVGMADNIMQYYQDIEFSLSGGIWSYISFLSFVEAGYKPPVKICQLPKDINRHDVEGAVALAKYTGCPVEIIKISLKEELLDSYIAIAEKYQTYNFTDAMMARVAELNQNNIFIADSIVVKRNTAPGWRLVLDEGSDFYWHRFNYANRHNIIKSFFTGSPDILYQFFQLDTVRDILDDNIKNKLSTNTSLRKIFIDAGWRLPERLFMRYTFNDALPEFSKKMNYMITKKMGFKKTIVSIPCDKLLQGLQSDEGYQCSFA
jgi:hypothetical protein